jgi:anaerobic selenocysteine-containing dehydrogenase
MDKQNSLLKVLKEFEAIASSGYPEITSHLPKNRAPIGFFCPYVPEELIHAAGALPFRIMGTPNTCTQGQICFYPRSVMARTIVGYHSEYSIRPKTKCVVLLGVEPLIARPIVANNILKARKNLKYIGNIRYAIINKNR